VRGVSTSPFNRSRANRSRQRRTQCGARPTLRAIARVPTPLAASSTHRARTATQAPVRPARHKCRRTRRSAGDNRITTSGSGHLCSFSWWCVRLPMPSTLRQSWWASNFLDTALAKLDALPGRKLWPHMRKAYEHQFLNASCVFGVGSGCRRLSPPPVVGTASAMPPSSWASPPSLDIDWFPSLRTCRLWGASLLRGRGTHPRAGPTQFMNRSGGTCTARLMCLDSGRETLAKVSGLR
jgi:hypothetical protein